MKMKALTLYPEWGAAIRWLGKSVENRSWHPGKAMIGQRVAIHVGKRLNGGKGGRKAYLAAAEAVNSMYGGVVDIEPNGLHFDLAYETPAEFGLVCRERIAFSTIVCTVRLADVVRDSPSPWAVPGAWHWCIDDMQPVDCGHVDGKVSLWDVDLDALRRAA